MDKDASTIDLEDRAARIQALIRSAWLHVDEGFSELGALEKNGMIHPDAGRGVKRSMDDISFLLGMIAEILEDPSTS